MGTHEEFTEVSINMFGSRKLTFNEGKKSPVRFQSTDT